MGKRKTRQKKKKRLQNATKNLQQTQKKKKRKGHKENYDKKNMLGYSGVSQGVTELESL